MKYYFQKIVRTQKGQAFPMVLVILAMGSLFVTSFLTAVNTNFLFSDVYSKPVPDNYAADAGIEDAIWGLKYGTLADTIASQGGEVTYLLPNQVNGNVPEITVTASGAGGSGIVASHDFDDNSWSGGSGWLNAWIVQGNIALITSQNPAQGTRHVQMRGADANLFRAVDLSAASDVRLQFWAKVRTFNANDKLYCRVSPDNINWTDVKVFDVTYSDNLYYYYDLDLSSIPVSSEFWIAFISGMDQNNDYFYLDDVKITAAFGTSSYKIVSAAGQRTTTVTLDGENYSIKTWILD